VNSTLQTLIVFIPLVSTANAYNLLCHLLQCQTLVDELSASHSTDLQQRAYELQALLGLDKHAVESVMPSDASCEDIEVPLLCLAYLLSSLLTSTLVMCMYNIILAVHLTSRNLL
jgi:hypothetical protein